MKRWVLVILGIFVGTSVVLYIWTGNMLENGQEPKADGTNEYAIVLGAKVKENGQPSLALQYRLDETIEYMKTYSHVKVIVSGGQGMDEPISEADFMYIYLADSGIEKDRIICENKATSTYENIVYSKELLPKDVKEVTIISSDFHLARAKLIASNLGLTADVVAAKTPKVVELKLQLRERVALLKTMITGK